MSGDIPLTAVAETSRGYIKDEIEEEFQDITRDNGKIQQENEKSEKKTSLLRRLSSFRSTLRPNFGKLRCRFQRINCVRAEEDEDEEEPFMDIPRRVCLVEAESSRRTDAIGGPDDDGSYDYGLFQINDRYWCNSADRPGKGCQLRCQDLLSENIAVASLCAKKIFSRQGFTAWVGWENECYNKTLPDISNCTNR